MKFNINKIKVGERIFNIRNSLNLTLEQFGKDPDINAERSNVSKWERGATLPNKARLKVIAKKGNMTINELLYGSIDEFLINNLDNLLLNSDFPFFIDPVDLPQSTDIYIDNINMVNENKITINNIDDIIEAFYTVLNDIIDNTVLSFYDERFYSLIEKFKSDITDILKDERLKQAIYICSTKYDYEKIKKLRTAIVRDLKINKDEIIEIPNNFDVNSAFNNLIYNDNKKNKVAFHVFFEYIILKLENNIKSNLELSRLSIIYISFEDLEKENINLYNIMYDFTFHIQTRGYFLNNNKYNLTNYKNVVALYIEQEKTLYYLANYDNFRDVPLNLEAEYFILNHDNTYQITKITEIPDCIYIAPVIGRLE